VSTTLAAGNTPPLLSVTEPEITPVAVCACKIADGSTSTKTVRNALDRIEPSWLAIQAVATERVSIFTE
jgi:hypothetical protein